MGWIVHRLAAAQRLTNFKKLFMPEPPTPQQQQCIRQLRQLRHVHASGRAGEFCFWKVFAVELACAAMLARCPH